MIDVAFLGAHVRPAGTAVVIDVLRATSTITLALASGYERVVVAGGIDAARELRADGRVLAGEHECQRPADFDIGNSPEETLEPRGPELILATTNGAPAILGALAVCDDVLVACLLNEDAVVEALASISGDILLVAAGTNGAMSVEDVYLAGPPQRRTRGAAHGCGADRRGGRRGLPRADRRARGECRRDPAARRGTWDGT